MVIIDGNRCRLNYSSAVIDGSLVIDDIDGNRW